MNWFEENRWLGKFVIALGVATLLALVLLFVTKGGYNKARAKFSEIEMERNRLERRDPFPKEDNFGKFKSQIDKYGTTLNDFKEGLKQHVLSAPQIAPYEFQSRLRQAINDLADRARTNRVKLPDNFRLGFDEFAVSLPATEAASSLGQELAQTELLVGILIDARIDGLTSLTRKPAPPANAPTGTTAATGTPQKPTIIATRSNPQAIERNVVDLTFAASPSAQRKALNQIAGATQQLFVIRTLDVHNEKDKGPARQATAAGTAAAAPASATSTVLNFIVGNEHVETTAQIEMLRLGF